MPPNKRLRQEAGSAVVEFIFLVTLLLVPVVYLLLTVASVQAGSFASVGAADQAAKVFAASDTPAEGRLRAERAVLLAVTDLGFDQSAATLNISCQPAACLDPGSSITAVVQVEVQLPLIPATEHLSLAVTTVSASATEMVARFG